VRPPKEVTVNAVQLVSATAGLHPTGTGSYAYGSSFLILVDNLAFEKVVGIWGRDVGTSNWSFVLGQFDQSVPGNGEFWRVGTSKRIDQFVVRYDVGGVSLFDNNFGNNYILDVAAAEQTDGVGSAVIVPNVLSEDGFIDGSHQLVVGVAVKNLAFTKQVGVVYTWNNWTTAQVRFGNFQKQYQPSLLPAQAQVESWEVHAPLTASPAQFAVFYTVNGTTFWDNNFGRNFKAV
jgi:hypothetical protein